MEVRLEWWWILLCLWGVLGANADAVGGGVDRLVFGLRGFMGAVYGEGGGWDWDLGFQSTRFEVI